MFQPLLSNSYESALNFLRAAFEDDQVTGGWQDLVRARHGLLQMFEKEQVDNQKDILEAILTLDPQQVGGYGAYLEAAYYFYTGLYDKALSIYSKLKSSVEKPSLFARVRNFFKKQPQTNWLKETAAYMEARTLLLMAQDKINGYESDEELKENLHFNLLNRSYDLFQAYLKDYPQGRYADSVRNLQRKFYRLKRQRKEFDNALREALNTELADTSSEEIHQLIVEVDSEFVSQIQMTDAPLLIAKYILATPLKPKELQEILTALEQQKKRFSPFPGLFDFLKTLVLYRLEKYQDLVTTIPAPKDIKQENVLLISTAVLRAKATYALGDYPSALTLLKRLKPLKEDHIDLLLLRTHIALKNPKDVILKDLEESERVLEAFIEGGLRDNELKVLVQEEYNFSHELHKKLREVLLKRYLITGQLKEALELDSPAYENLSSIKRHIQALLVNPNDPISLLEMGKWLLENVQPSSLPEELKKECAECEVSIPFVPPLNYFLKIITNSVESKKKSMAEAEALHYLISVCFHHGSMYPYACKWCGEYGGTAEAIALQEMRKNDAPRWFRRLHTVYKESIWAKETPYYY